MPRDQVNNPKWKNYEACTRQVAVGCHLHGGTQGVFNPAQSSLSLLCWAGASARPGIHWAVEFYRTMTGQKIKCSMEKQDRNKVRPQCKGCRAVDVLRGWWSKASVLCRAERDHLCLTSLLCSWVLWGSNITPENQTHPLLPILNFVGIQFHGIKKSPHPFA